LSSGDRGGCQKRPDRESQKYFIETELKRFRRESYFQRTPFIANDLQQGDLIAEFTKFPASCIARGIVGPAWEHKKNVTAQMPRVSISLTDLVR
jgi:hypothetical protein